MFFNDYIINSKSDTLPFDVLNNYKKTKHAIWQITNNNISSRNLIFLLLNAKKDNRIESITIIELKKIKLKLLLYDQPPFSTIASEPR